MCVCLHGDTYHLFIIFQIFHIFFSFPRKKERPGILDTVTVGQVILATKKVANCKKNPKTRQLYCFSLYLSPRCQIAFGMADYIILLYLRFKALLESTGTQKKGGGCNSIGVYHW